MSDFSQKSDICRQYGYLQMICSNCGTENRESANFCRRCGMLLTTHCPRCGTDVLVDADYCDHCGLPLTPRATSGWAMGWNVQGQQIAAPKIAAPLPPLATPRPAAQPAITSALPVTNATPATSAASVTTTAPVHLPTTTVETAPSNLLQKYAPSELLDKLHAARAHGEMVGERRIVTMLFCDVKGSTDFAETLDPEEWTEIMNGAYERMIRAVYKYEGTVARLLGDAILAFFGAPIAHEDDPQRAVLAGLDIVTDIAPYCQQIKQEWGIEFNVRVGINTGLVVVGAVGSDLRVEYTALGDAINLAARMEQTAQPGTVQIAHETYKLVKPLFEVEELGRIEVKGKSEPVLAYRVLGRKAFVGRVRGIEGLHAEMVGRDEELQALRNVIADLQQGLGRIVCVLGEAGVGKSRLVSEGYQVFKDLIGANGNWHESISLSYETNHAYGLFQQLMQRACGIAHGDPPPVVRTKLTSLVERMAEARRPGAAQVFGALFGLESNGALPLEGDAFKHELFEAVREWWRAHFADRPTVLVFDDMHWTDAPSVELFQRLLSLTEEMPLVLLCAMRTERQAPAWEIRTISGEEYHHRYSEIMLQPLSAAESNELVNRLLPNADLPDRLRATILEKTGGNPFFIEEVVRALIDRGVVVAEERSVEGQTQCTWRATSDGADLDIPGNVQSLLATRIDRLEEATRSTLQVASVIGRSFGRRVLQAVDEDSHELDKHLGTLIRVDMIREAARVPEVEYAFLNPLTQEAVYKTILLKRRREFHRRVAEAMEALYADRLEGLYGLLVHHFARAGLRDKAIQYARRASQQAASLYAYDEAAQNLHAALELLEPGDKSDALIAIHLTLLEELGDVDRLLRDGKQAIEHYQQALDLWHERPDADKLIAVRLHRKIVQVVDERKWTVGVQDLQQANESRLASRASLEADLGRMQAEPPHLETVRVLVTLSTDAWRMQNPPDWDTAQRFALDAVDMAEQLDSPVDLSQALGALATVLDGRSLLREHLKVAQRRLAICREPQFTDLRERMEAVRGAGAALMYVGEYEQALDHLREAEELATQAQVVEQQVSALGLQAQCMLRLDRWDDVLANEQKWRDLERRYTRERVGETCFFIALSASVHAMRGDQDQAKSYLKESYDYMVAVSGLPEQWQRNQFY
jgi:class 3 adenylate cyclase/tetratricopeptide (TPR) repeat protein